MYFRIVLVCIFLLLSGCARVYHNFYGKPMKGYNPVSVWTNLNSFTDYFKHTKIESAIHIQAADLYQPSLDDSLYSILVYFDIDYDLGYKSYNQIDLSNIKLSNFSITCITSTDPQIVSRIGKETDEMYIPTHSTSYSHDEGWINFGFGDHIIPIICNNINVGYTLTYSDNDTVITELVNFPMKRIAGHTWSLAAWILAD